MAVKYSSVNDYLLQSSARVGADGVTDGRDAMVSGYLYQNGTKPGSAQRDIVAQELRFMLDNDGQDGFQIDKKARKNLEQILNMTANSSQDLYRVTNGFTSNSLSAFGIAILDLNGAVKDGRMSTSDYGEFVNDMFRSRNPVSSGSFLDNMEEFHDKYDNALPKYKNNLPYTERHEVSSPDDFKSLYLSGARQSNDSVYPDREQGVSKQVADLKEYGSEVQDLLGLSDDQVKQFNDRVKSMETDRDLRGHEDDVSTYAYALRAALNDGDKNLVKELADPTIMMLACDGRHSPRYNDVLSELGRRFEDPAYRKDALADAGAKPLVSEIHVDASKVKSFENSGYAKGWGNQPVEFDTLDDYILKRSAQNGLSGGKITGMSEMTNQYLGKDNNASEAFKKELRYVLDNDGKSGLNLSFSAKENMMDLISGSWRGDDRDRSEISGTERIALGMAVMDMNYAVESGKMSVSDYGTAINDLFSDKTLLDLAKDSSDHDAFLDKVEDFHEKYDSVRETDKNPLTESRRNEISSVRDFVDAYEKDNPSKAYSSRTSVQEMLDGVLNQVDDVSQRLDLSPMNEYNMRQGIEKLKQWDEDSNHYMFKSDNIKGYAYAVSVAIKDNDYDLMRQLSDPETMEDICCGRSSEIQSVLDRLDCHVSGDSLENDTSGVSLLSGVSSSANYREESKGSQKSTSDVSVKTEASKETSVEKDSEGYLDFSL